MNKLLIALLFIPTLSFAGVENLSGFDDKNISVHNDNLQFLNGNVNVINTVLRDRFSSGILLTAHGGTGQNFSAVTANSVPYFSSLGTMGTIGIGTTGYVFTAGNPPSWQPALGNYAAGDYLIAGPSSLVEVSGNTNYTKIAEVYLPRGGVIRCKFWIASDDGSVTTYGRIYRNGVAVGVEKTQVGIGTTDASDDVSGWTAGDLLQLYAKVSASSGNQVAGGLRLYEGAPLTEIFGSGGLGKQAGSLTYKGDVDPADATGIGSIGDLLMRSTGGASTTLYVKTGATTWTAK